MSSGRYNVVSEELAITILRIEEMEAADSSETSSTRYHIPEADTLTHEKFIS